MIKQMGSYALEDVKILLKNLNGLIEEQSNDYREKQIQSGVHYSEMLPMEYVPSETYMTLYRASLERTKLRLAQAVASVSETLLEQKGKGLVLVSLARAGIPAGILMRRYLKYRHGVDVEHYSVSIIRGKGIDSNALKYICSRHRDTDLVFVDGWTGKGAITRELTDAVEDFNQRYQTAISPKLAVIADPGDCAEWYGTKDDFLIPSSLLNSTVSGLISRTVLRSDLIGSDDFHGAKVYDHLREADLSYCFIQAVESCFEQVSGKALPSGNPGWKGMADVLRIQDRFDVEDIHFVKPGIGETTRVLLRRVPWKVILDDRIAEDHEDVAHIIQLAKEKQVPVERLRLSAYTCCGLIKSVRGDRE